MQTLPARRIAAVTSLTQRLRAIDPYKPLENALVAPMLAYASAPKEHLLKLPTTWPNGVSQRL